MDRFRFPKSERKSYELPLVNEEERNHYSDKRETITMENERSVSEGALSVKGCNELIFSQEKKSMKGNFLQAREMPSSTFTELKHFLQGKLNLFLSLFNTNRTGSDNYRNQVAIGHDMQNPSHVLGVKSIKNSLNRLGLPTVLLKLEKSLEDVKRNKISKEDHEQLFQSVDKELRRLSLRYHPDRASRGLKLGSVEIHECQSVLNAIRKALKILTEVFLENIFIDYKYEYFSNLNIRLLVNDTEIDNTIKAMLYKICALSETKRINIIGEIRKFLQESERCVNSYFLDHKSDFEKYRDYALYHLKINIEGYKKLEKECNMLNEECSQDNDQNMIAVVQSVIRQSSTELPILISLERVARNSFQGNFEIFPVNKTMDEYYILPFVDYVNVLSMCTLLLYSKRPKFFSFSKVYPDFTEERDMFREAYMLASFIFNEGKRWNMKTTVTSHCALTYMKNRLHEKLKTIFSFLKEKFRMDVYNEGRSNMAEMYDKSLALEKVLEDIGEKEIAFEEKVNRYLKERRVIRISHEPYM